MIPIDLLSDEYITAFVNPLVPRKKARNPNVETIKAWIWDLLRLPDDVIVTVSEAACRDIGCPDVETVVSVFEVGQPTRLLRIGKPVDRIGESDILVGLAFEGSVPAVKA